MRFASLFGLGAALVCAALLVACGGGGGSAPVAGGSLTGSHGSSHGPGTTLTIVIHRGNAHKYLTKLNARHRGAQAIRNPQYISGNAEGLQVTVSATGVASQSVYADLTGSLCNTSGPVSTCTLNVPTIGANEQFSMLEVDQTPVGTNGSYGTGFATGANILGSVTQAETVTLGAANALSIQIDPVDAGFYDVSGCFPVPTPLPSAYNPNYGIDTSGVNNAGSGRNLGSRVVVTGGVAATGAIMPLPFDGTGDCFFDATPAPFVDVNGSPTPMTLTSNSAALTVAPVVRQGTPPPAAAYSQTASIANDGYVWYGCQMVIGVNTSASFTAPATIVLNNNLTALNPFLSPPSSYAESMTYTVATLSVSSTTATVSQSGTVFLTATDYGAANGTDGESSYTANNGPGNGGQDEACNSGGTQLAYVFSSGPINTTTWQQRIEIEGAGNGTGTCTFYVTDFEALTLSQPITVTVTP